jgi:8-oxo-dGTP pyrophosphatase MutT (NUDIX family)
MDGILRGEGDWQGSIARALAAADRPIAADPRLLPRDASLNDGLPRFDRAAFPPARLAATLLLIYPGDDGGLTVPLTVRHAELRAHAGEISLPGGAVDPSDGSRAETALREAREEVGLDPGLATIIGELDDVWIPVSNFELRPYVATAEARPMLRPHSAEVEEIVELPLALLVSAGSISEELIEGPGWSLRAGVYRHAGHRIWGATARTLAMFASVLEQAGIGA